MVLSRGAVIRVPDSFELWALPSLVTRRPPLAGFRFCIQAGRAGNSQETGRGLCLEPALPPHPGTPATCDSLATSVALVTSSTSRCRLPGKPEVQLSITKIQGWRREAESALGWSRWTLTPARTVSAWRSRRPPQGRRDPPAPPGPGVAPHSPGSIQRDCAIGRNTLAGAQ